MAKEGKGWKSRLVAVLYGHSVVESALLLLISVVRLVFLRGLSLGTVLLFLAPPLLAFAVLWHSVERWARAVAHAFLATIVLGVLIAPFPAILPNLGGVDRALPLQSDRLLTWYVVCYMFFALGIAPASMFAIELGRHRKRLPTNISISTCYAGLVTFAILLPFLGYLLGSLLGLWQHGKN